MSTRCNIVIKSGQSTVYMYRHCDGYLAETGADLLAKIEAANGVADKFLRSLFSEYYEQQSYEKQPRRVYELTTELHGDIEHCYTIEFKDDFVTGKVSIRHAERPKSWGDDNLETGDWAWMGKRHTTDSLRDAVNTERKASNARLAKLAQENPHYKQYEPYPMLEAPEVALAA